MQHRARVRQRLQQRACPASVIQVHVSQKHVVHRGAGDTQLLQRGEQIGHRIVRADIDEGRTPAVLNDVRGGVARDTGTPYRRR